MGTTGPRDGARDGELDVGDKDGRLVGRLVGDVVTAVGFTVGDLEGERVGKDVVGAFEGLDDGLREGDALVGDLVGAWAWHTRMYESGATSAAVELSVVPYGTEAVCVPSKRHVVAPDEPVVAAGA